MEQSEDPILFFKVDEPFGEFICKYPVQFREGPFLYLSSEHYFQSKKFEGSDKE
jgi:N-glycosidase YbiA